MCTSIAKFQRLAVHFFSFIKVMSLQNAHMSFSKDGYGLDVGGGCGSGPVFLISVVSYHYIIFVSTSVSLACIHVLGSPAGQAICLGAHVNMPPMNVFALLACKNEYMNTHVLACPVLIHKYICTYMHPMQSRINSWSPCKNK